MLPKSQMASLNLKKKMYQGNKLQMNKIQNEIQCEVNKLSTQRNLD